MITYKDAGVDLQAGYEAVKLIQDDLRSTRIPGVLDTLANFGGLFELDEADIRERPVLVAGADGVGTKLKIAVALDKHDTVGIDCVAMCVNDIACLGARPLFFLDYIALGKLEPRRVAEIVRGMAAGCRETGCALLGGETAEMPGMYKPGEYDVAGFAVGIVARDRLIDGSRVGPGDALVGLESSGMHSNGFSLVRRLFHIDGQSLSRYVSDLKCTLGEELLRPTRLYVRPMRSLIAQVDVHGAANITGGGFLENIPRMLPKGMRARIRSDAWKVPPVFGIVRAEGELDDEAMFNTFNMGIGMVVAVAASDAKKAVEVLRDAGCPAHVIGEVAEGGAGVELCHRK
ncbi:MAG: phosphoribosylformylglycinamidine cyclo-ligase [Christensenellales bacterium]|jgi:phosphoribosylformylglycinamidine cyclo-ligase